MSTYWIYLLQCSDDSFYTGITNNMEKRYRQHRTGTGGCKYTRSRSPVRLAQCWIMLAGHSEALQAELRLKALSHDRKAQLIVCPDLLSEMLTGDLQLLPFDPQLVEQAVPTENGAGHLTRGANHLGSNADEGDEA